MIHGRQILRVPPAGRTIGPTISILARLRYVIGDARWRSRGAAAVLLTSPAATSAAA